MRLTFLGVALALLLTGPVAYAQMNDRQVLTYVENSMRENKGQQEIALELARRGVTREQAERVMKLYEQKQKKNGSQLQDSLSDGTRLRGRYLRGEQDFFDGRDVRNQQYQQRRDSLVYVQDNEDEAFLNELLYPQEKERVFGRNIFNTRNLSFEPNSNMATPPNYRLGPGDEVIIDIWGASQNTIRQTLSPDGTINLQELGPVYLSGLTVRDAERYLQSQLSRLYSNENNQIKVTLGNSRTIQINIMGEVVQPGTYALSAFASVLHGLYRAGGVSEIGSLRDVRLVRGGKTVATVDVYDLILNGKVSDDLSLQEGDVIIVPSYEMLVEISGNVKRNLKFEMKNGETVADLLSYAGGFDADAYTESLNIVRQNGTEYEMKTIDRAAYAATPLQNGDAVRVGAILNTFANRVEILGAVYRPDVYELGGRIKTVRQLIEHADGLMDDAFTARAVLQRQRDDMTREILSVDVAAVMNGTAHDIELRKNDILYIPSIHDLHEFGDITIYGEVARPGAYPYADNLTVEDLILQAGGLRDAASTARIDVSRRVKDPARLSEIDTIGKVYTFALKDGFVVDGRPGFVLEPYDQVYVRRSPGYQEQVNVRISGEVMFDGEYALSTRTERISDLVRKAGGLTASAYTRGASLTRVANADERKRMLEVRKQMLHELGSERLDDMDLELDTLFTVGIDLDAALSSPGSDADLVLREGDVLTLPKYENTVKISGAVMMPNTVSYDTRLSVKDYIDMAGGYSQSARKSKAFVVYMNGTIAKAKKYSKAQVEPGCEIIIPAKERQDEAKMSRILGYTSSIASLGMTIATIATLILR